MKKTQNKMLLDYLRKGRKITTAVAMDIFGIGSLSRRICDLKQAGHDIHSRTIKIKNQWGYDIRIKQYWLFVPVVNDQQHNNYSHKRKH